MFELKSPLEETPDRLARLPLLAGFVGLAMACSVLAHRQLSDYDLPWNLATGRVIAATRAIPKVDTLAFTHANLRYVEGLGDLFVWRVLDLLGPLGLQVLGALVFVTTLAVSSVRSRGSGTSTALFMAWLGAAIAAWFTVRPASFSFLFIVTALLFIDVHRRSLGDESSAARDPSPKAARTGFFCLSATIPLLFVWANVHGYVAIGAALLWMHVATLIVEYFASRRARGPAWPRKLVVVRRGVTGRETAFAVGIALVATVAASINTMGPALLLGPLRSHEALGQITEWARPTGTFFFSEVPIATAFFVAALAAIAFGSERDGARALSLYDLLLVAFAACGFFCVVRLAPVALLILAPIAARRAMNLVPDTRLMLLAGGAAPLAAGAYLFLSVPTSRAPGFDASRLPVHAAEFIERSAPSGHMYNFMPFGGYLAYRLGPRYEVFNDGRNALARRPGLVKRASAALTDVRAFDDLVSEYDLTWAVTSSIDGESFDVPLARAPRFRLVYLDDVAAVYVRTDSDNARLTSGGYRVLRHLISLGSILDRAVHGGPDAVDLAHDGALAAAQAPSSARAHFLEAAGGIAVRDEAMFERGLTALVSVAPSHPAVAALARAWALASRKGRAR